MASDVTVPADHRGLFEREARFTLEAAANSVRETLTFQRQGKREPDPGQLDHERRKLLDAEDLHGRATAQDGDVRLEGTDEPLRETIHGCLLAAADELKGECEKTDGARRAALDEVDLWLGMLESVEEEGRR